MAVNPKVYIIILNWNGWKDTIECLESVFRLEYDNYHVVVCDNNSSDGSIERIKAWAEGLLDVLVPLDNQLRHYSYPPVQKMISTICYGRDEAEFGGTTDDSCYRLTLIQTGANLGFAGGNNVGLRYAMAKNDCEYVWLLNNDTVVNEKALTRLITSMQDNLNTGMCGSLLIDYHRPDYIQAAGAGFDMRFARPLPIFAGKLLSSQISEIEISDKLAYPVGASVLTSRLFLEKVGLLCEDYFLYFEEIDWTMRAKGRFDLAIATASHVYHKDGASIGHPKYSSTAFYFIQLNRLRFTSRFNPGNIPILVLYILAQICKALVFGRRSMALASLRALFNFTLSHVK